MRTIDMQSFRELMDGKCTCKLSLLDADADLTASTDKFPGCVKGLSRNCPTHREEMTTPSELDFKVPLKFTGSFSKKTL